MSITKQHLETLQPSSTLLINETSKEMERNGKTIYKFGFGQSPFPVPDKLIQKLKENAHQKDYLPAKGLLSLRQAIALNLSKKKYKHFTENNIVIGPGSKELMFLLQICFDGDLILPAPSWVSYEPQSIIAKNNVHWIQTSADSNWHVTAKQIEEVAKKIKSQNKLIILNSPNNPSGTNAKNLKELAEVFEKHNFTVLSDEIYSDLHFGDEFHSIAHFYPKTIISNGLSKWAGAGGWRLGYFAIPDSLKEINDKISVLATETFSAVSAPIQFAAVEAYEGDHSEYVNKSIKILKVIADAVYKKFNTNNIQANKPEGGFYIMPDFTNLLSHKFKSSKEFCKLLLEETGVAVLPGTDFGFPEEKLLFRFSFVDFDGAQFLKVEDKEISEDNLKNYAPKILEGVEKILDFTKKHS
ncbi:aminotransferase class I/II-fold pyridoxal phosphate-dependent enzyme [Pelagibacteraceae bacterium]|nr:aminotransferase class I/II-fold pyridoxal phosphate-dependent enzyme [Pelagibacteraceae bacterium]